MDAMPVVQDGDSVRAGEYQHGKLTFWERVVTKIWDHDYYTKSPAERRLVFKLDCFMLTALTIGWWLKNIDQSNLTNAIPTCDNLQCGHGNYHNPDYKDMYGFRFCVAFFESAFYPGALYILGSWYNRAELAKRIALWFMAGPAGNAFSGYLQAAIYTSLDGVGGIAGWRWLYIVCGCMTVPCGVILFFLLPDHPGTPGKIWYLTEEEKKLALVRRAKKGTGTATSRIRWVHIVRSVKKWRFWLITPTYVVYGLGLQNAQQFAIYLKAMGYSVALRNILASTMYIIEIFTVVIYSYISDRIKYRFPVTVIPMIWGCIPTGILAVWPPHHRLRLFAFIVNNSLYMTPVFYAWVSEICYKSDEERSFIIATTSTLFFVMNAFLPSVLFLQTDGPSFRKGFPTTFGFIVSSIFFLTAMFIFHQRQVKRDKAKGITSVEAGQVEPVSLDADVEEKEEKRS
ncbi:hypothetical protein CI109_106700 [Kwoniella shandongensis]|uniref:Major facilitator superfamily (MFS) profile domain-containing protein n=1 Tax=Kwoniella shandongensis TaxID=1734106 RepID=A0AAJ8LSW9_9TREE